jgi:hypothetical protein
MAAACPGDRCGVRERALLPLLAASGLRHATLIAALECARDGALALDQAADWMPIRAIRRAHDGSAVGDPTPPA